jgi:glycosyltransferase involved in cell wall biosynthesis
MKVCLHIQAVIAQRAGIGRYVHTLVPELAAQRGNDELSAFYFDFRRNGSPFAPGLLDEHACRWLPGALVQQAWKRIAFPPVTCFAPRADLHFFPNYIIPPLPRGPRAVVSVHDLGLLRFPETLEPKNLAYLRARLPKSIARAERILAISETMAAEIREAYNLPAEKVRATLLGPPPALAELSHAAAEDRLRELNIDGPYLLHVGTLEPRKNHAFLFQVFERLKDFDGHLILCGPRGWKTEPILDALRDSPAHERIRHLDYVRDDQLSALYRRATALVFPSLYEGFGLPPIEAMRQGCPVVCSTGGSLPEVVGDAGIVLPLDDPDAWVAALQSLLHDGDTRQRLIAAGHVRADGFSWKRCAEETWAVFRDCGIA